METVTRFSVLAALAWLGAAAPRLEDGTCGEGFTRSSSGECSPPLLHSGLSDFLIPSVDLLEDQEVQITVDLNAATHRYIHFQLCSADSCNLIVVWGDNAVQELFYVNFTSCNAAGDWTTGSRGPDVKPSGAAYFPSGQYVFVAQHRPSELALWMKGHPEGGAIVAATGSHNKLRVRPEVWNTEMPVNFQDVRDIGDFLCDDGSSSFNVWSKCDGFYDCDDGSDESEDICDVPVASVSVGELVTVRVQHEEKQGHVDVSLCDNASCSTLALYGSAPQGAPWFFSWTGCNARGANCTAGVEEFPIGRKYFPSGEVVLIVQRRSSELAVWIDGSPESVANVTIGANYRKLRVRPIY